MIAPDPSAESSARPLSWAVTGLIVAIAVILGVSRLFGLMRLRRWAEEARERDLAERRAELVEQVRAGTDRSPIVFLDARAIGALAKDPQCVANLKELHLNSMEINADDAAPAGLWIRSCQGGTATQFYKDSRLTSRWEISSYGDGKPSFSPEGLMSFGLGASHFDMHRALYIPHWFLTASSLGLAALLAFKRTWRFSLRTLLIGTTLLAALLGLAIYVQ